MTIDMDTAATLASEPSPYLTLKEAARLLGCADRTLRAWWQEGLIRTVRIGRAKRVLREEILRALGAQEGSTEPYDINVVEVQFEDQLQSIL